MRWLHWFIAWDLRLSVLSKATALFEVKRKIRIGLRIKRRVGERRFTLFRDVSACLNTSCLSSTSRCPISQGKHKACNIYQAKGYPYHVSHINYRATCHVLRVQSDTGQIHLVRSDSAHTLFTPNAPESGRAGQIFQLPLGGFGVTTGGTSHYQTFGMPGGSGVAVPNGNTFDVIGSGSHVGSANTRN
jgi:hypothetical protein